MISLSPPPPRLRAHTHTQTHTALTWECSRRLKQCHACHINCKKGALCPVICHHSSSSSLFIRPPRPLFPPPFLFLPAFSSLFGTTALIFLASPPASLSPLLGTPPPSRNLHKGSTQFEMKSNTPLLLGGAMYFFKKRLSAHSSLIIYFCGLIPNRSYTDVCAAGLPVM